MGTSGHSSGGRAGGRAQPLGRQIWIFMAFGFGVAFVIAMLVLAIQFPNPTAFQYLVFRVVLALAAAGVASTIPGFIELKVSAGAKFLLHAGGALAVFAIVYYQSPAQLLGNPQEAPTTPPLPSQSVPAPASSERRTIVLPGRLAESEASQRAKPSTPATLRLGNVDDFQSGTYVVTFSPPKKYHISRLTNPGKTSVNISLVGFPEQYFYTSLSHEPSLIHAGEDRDFSLVLLNDLPDTREYPFTLTVIPDGDDPNDSLRVSIHVQGDWESYLQDQLKHFAHKLSRLEAPTAAQIYRAAQEATTDDYKNLAPDLRNALTGNFLVRAEKTEAAAFAYAKAESTAPKVVERLLAAGPSSVAVALGRRHEGTHDYQRALVWYRLAADLGDQSSLIALEERERIRLAEAQRRAAELERLAEAERRRLEEPRSKKLTAPIKHTVREGETLASIAKRYNVTVARLKELNGADLDKKLRTGGTIIVEVEHNSSDRIILPAF